MEETEWASAKWPRFSGRMARSDLRVEIAKQSAHAPERGVEQHLGDLRANRQEKSISCGRFPSLEPMRLFPPPFSPWVPRFIATAMIGSLSITYKPMG